MKSLIYKLSVLTVLIVALVFCGGIVACAENSSDGDAYIYEIGESDKIDIVVTGLGAYIKFTPDVGGEYWLLASSSYDTNCTLYDENFDLIYLGEEFDDAGDGADFCFKFTLKAGETYYYLVQVPEKLRIYSLSFFCTIIMKQPEAGHVHNWTESVALEPTCTESGLLTKRCVCRMNTESEIPSLGHSGKITVVEPTCTAAGSKERVCLTCGVKETTVIAALGHNYSSTFTVDKAATCTAAGSKSKHCTRCTAKKDVTAIPATGHSFGNYSVRKAATCTTSGSKERVCSICGTKETATFAALGHNYSSSYTVDKAATCTTSGSKSKHCTRCTAKTEVTAIPVTGHTYGGYVDTKAATCIASGSKERKCTVCGAKESTVISALGHKYAGVFTVDKESTCTEKGSKSKHCIRCTAKTEVMEIPETGHTFGIFTVTKAATCTASGNKTRKCTVCNAKDSDAIPPLGHRFSSDFTVDKEATCTSVGSKSKHCMVCSEKSDVTSIPATGHILGEYIVTKAATCTAAGSVIRKCKNCSEKETLVVEPFGHDFSKEYTVDKSPTCMTTGTKSFHCTRCDAKTGAVSIEATGHSFGEYKTTLKATCIASGKMVRTCSVCKKEDSKSISKLGHNYSSHYTVDKKATPNENGSKSQHCKRCDAITNQTSIPKLSLIKLSSNSYVFNGKAKTPSVTVKDSKGSAISSKHYKVTYPKDCSSIGKHTVKVSFSSSKYEGIKKITFKILPGNVQGLGVSASGNNVRISWSKINGAEGYKVYLYSPSTDSFESLGKTSKTSYTASLPSGKVYTIAVKAFKNSGGKTFLSKDFSAIKCATAPKAVKIALNSKKGQANLSWNKVDCTGYEIYMSKSRNGAFVKVKTISSKDMTSFSKSGLKSGQLYYFQVRAFTKTGDLVEYSPYSNKVVFRA